MTEVFERLSKVMDIVGAVGKNKTNAQQGFKYRAIDDFIQAVHPALVSAGVVLIPEVLTHESANRPTKSGGISTHVVITAKFTFYAPDGSSVSGVTVGEAADSADKASNKAMSQALKYFLMQALMVPLEDLADGDRVTPDMGQVGGFDALPPLQAPPRDSRTELGIILKNTVEQDPAVKPTLEDFFAEFGIPKKPSEMTDEQVAKVHQFLQRLLLDEVMGSET